MYVQFFSMIRKRDIIFYETPSAIIDMLLLLETIVSRLCNDDATNASSESFLTKRRGRAEQHLNGKADIIFTNENLTSAIEDVGGLLLEIWGFTDYSIFVSRGCATSINDRG